MAEKTYVKISRCLLQNVVFHNEKLLKVWMWCLLKASYKERDVQIGMQTVHVLPGQFIFGRRTAAAELRFSESFVFRSIKRLESLQKLSIKSNNKFSLITIENWAFYQSLGTESEQQFEQQMNNKRTTDEQQMNTNNKVKKVKKVNNSLSDDFDQPENDAEQPETIRMQNYLCQELGIGLFGPTETKIVFDWVKRFNDGTLNRNLVVEAIGRTKQQSGDAKIRKKISYANGILVDWESKGIRSPDDLPDARKERDAVEDVPILNFDRYKS